MKPNCKTCRVQYDPDRCKACRKQYEVATAQISLRPTNLPSRSHPRGYGVEIPVDVGSADELDGLKRAAKKNLEALRNP